MLISVNGNPRYDTMPAPYLIQPDFPNVFETEVVEPYSKKPPSIQQ
jgi:hypothetical protein